MEVGISKGKKAITNYKTLEVFEMKKLQHLALLSANSKLVNSSIRVHMSYKRNNILGDKSIKKFKKFQNINSLEKYILNLDRQFLHAKTIGFIHPINKKKLNLPQICHKI